MTDENKRQYTPHSIEYILRNVVQEEIEERNESETTLMPMRKKLRTTFTGKQIFELERIFEEKKYLNAGERTNLSR